MNINIEDYLSDSEIKEIIKEEFRKAIRKSIDKNGVSTFIANLGYQNVFEMINEEAPEFEDEIKTKTKEVIDNLTDYSVFRKKDLVDKEDSLAQKYLEEAVENNKDIIEKKVKFILNELDKADISYEIGTIIEEKIVNLFNGKDEEN